MRNIVWFFVRYHILLKPDILGSNEYIVFVPGQKTLMQKFDNYQYRSDYFEQFCLYKYISQVYKKKIPRKTKNIMKKTIKFKTNHLQYKIYMQIKLI